MMFPRRMRKATAVFMLLVVVNSIVTPTVTYALTAGPTAPEATSFEPVDTTDLVDLKTGDFTYNVPLLNVPGPAGGYPLSLSYHAGIMPDVEASWTGLGFTLNPGSITRLVNGYPDDHKMIGSINREFWEGGKTTVFTAGLSVGLSNGVSVSADLAFANDTYKGHGLGASIGAGVGPLHVTGGVQPYGQTYSSVGIGIGAFDVSLTSKGEVGLGVNIGGTWGPKTAEDSETVTSKSQWSAIGISLSTGKGGGVSYSIGGIQSGVHSQRAGKISTYDKSWHVDIPVYYFNIRLGRSYSRYWIDESDLAWTYGALYLGSSQPDYNKAFDTYDVLDADIDIVDHNDAEKVIGGSFPDVDVYTVTAQGLGGSIEPYHYRQELFRQDKKDKDNRILVRSYSLGAQNADKVGFRFANDFSNRYEYTPGDFSSDNTLSFAFDGAPTTGENGNDGYVNNQLAGSKHVEWYSNRAIRRSDATQNPFANGFIDAVAEGFSRDENDQIGGFSITNSDGVTYHYALPAYSFDEIMRTQNTTKQKEEDGLYYNQLTKPEKYAHTWHLTAVTGPDFVDRNGNGLVDHGDWGYWVSFEYKKWADDYQWRNPGVGMHRDIDSDFEFYSAGKKSLYVLSRIITESHVAVFESSDRQDSREVLSLADGGFGHTPVYSNDSECYSNCVEGCANAPDKEDCRENCSSSCPPKLTGYSDITRSTFKLDRIKLFNYDDYVAKRTADANVLRGVNFTYDYSLAKGTPNSYTATGNENSGKLTLRSVEFSGKGNVSLIPPIVFDYAKNPDYKQDFYDMWGFYKNDYVASDNENISRLTTPASSVDVDAWSLTSVVSSLGAETKISYESDVYATPALYRNNILSISSVEANEPNRSVLLKINSGPIDVSTLGTLIKNSELQLLFRKVFLAKQLCVCGGYTSLSGSAMGNYYSQSALTLADGNILSVSANEIEIKDDGLYNLITAKSSNSNYTESGCVDVSGKTITPAIQIEPAVLVSGNIIVRENTTSYGGGIRVKGITLASGGEEFTTRYSYEVGTTTYEPVNFGRIDLNFENWPASTWSPERERIKAARDQYNKTLYKAFSNLLATARQMPGPGVMYDQITLREDHKTSDGILHILPSYATYNFEVFKDWMIGYKNSDVSSRDVNGTFSDVSFTKIKTKTVVLKDYTARIGNLKAIYTYHADGTLMSKIENKYLHDGIGESFDDNVNNYEQQLSDKFKSQGVVEQSFVRSHAALYDKGSPVPYASSAQNFSNEERYLLGVVAKRETFPSIQIGQTSTDAKTGVTNHTENLTFDFYSGDVTQLASTDSYGNSYLSVSEPAYRHYETMGLRINGPSYKHMLTQVAAQQVYLLNNGNRSALLSASVQTWSNSLPVVGVSDGSDSVWRKQSAYVWDENRP